MAASSPALPIDPAPASRIRVLIVCKDDEPGGTTRHYVDLARGLAELGVAVELLVPGRPGREHEVEAPGCTVRRVRSFARVFSTELSPAALFETAVRAADIVHLHQPNPLGLLGVLARARTPLVVTYHCAMARTFGPLGAAYLRLQRALFERADRIIVTSPPMRESADLRGFEDRVDVVPMGLRFDRMMPRPEDVEPARVLRERYGPRVVLFVGRLVYYKGLDVLLEAARHVPAAFVLVGDGNERARLEAKAAELGVASRVHFTGHVSDDDLRAHLLAANVVTLPSTVSEAFGLVQLEAALCGRPMVTTRLGTGIEWVNRDGVTGLVVPPGDAAALAAALSELLDDPARATRLGEAARARALAEFDAATMAARTLGIYREVLAARAATA